jgi:hypothetical protein
MTTTVRAEDLFFFRSFPRGAEPQISPTTQRPAVCCRLPSAIYLRDLLSAMNLDVFDARVAPLLSHGDIVALRCVSRAWCATADSLLRIKSVFVECTAEHRVTLAAARYAAIHGCNDLLREDRIVRVFMANSVLDDICWLKQRLAPTKDCAAAWISLVARNSDTVTKWLVNAFGLTRSDVIEGVHAAADGDRDPALDLQLPTPKAPGAAAAAGLEVAPNGCRVNNNNNNNTVSAGSCRGIFHHVCIADNIGAAQVLKERFELTAADVISEGDEDEGLLEICSKAGQLDMVKWLTQAFQVHKKSEALMWALQASCWTGRLDVAEWICDAFGFREADLLYCDPYQNICAYTHGQVAGLQWLTRKFNIRFNARSKLDIVAGFQSCCESGCITTASWMADTFALPKSAIASDSNLAFRMSCANGHLNMAQWIADRYHLQLTDAAAMDNFALKRACRRGSLDVVQWLAQRFPGLLNSSSSSSSSACGRNSDVVDREVFLESCNGGCIALVQWLAASFRVSLVDLMEGRRVALMRGHLAVCCWLSLAYGF